MPKSNARNGSNKKNKVRQQESSATSSSEKTVETAAYKNIRKAASELSEKEALLIKKKKQLDQYQYIFSSATSTTVILRDSEATIRMHIEQRKKMYMLAKKVTSLRDPEDEIISLGLKRASTESMLIFMKNKIDGLSSEINDYDSEYNNEMELKRRRALKIYNKVKTFKGEDITNFDILNYKRSIYVANVEDALEEIQKLKSKLQTCNLYSGDYTSKIMFLTIAKKSQWECKNGILQRLIHLLPEMELGFSNLMQWENLYCQLETAPDYETGTVESVMAVDRELRAMGRFARRYKLARENQLQYPPNTLFNAIKYINNELDELSNVKNKLNEKLNKVKIRISYLVRCREQSAVSESKLPLRIKEMKLKLETIDNYHPYKITRSQLANVKKKQQELLERADEPTLEDDYCLVDEDLLDECNVLIFKKTILTKLAAKKSVPPEELANLSDF